MIVRHKRLDKVLLLGASLGMLSLFLGWVTLRTNRLSSGLAVPVWGCYGPEWTVLMGLVWILVAFLSFRQVGRPFVSSLASGLTGIAMAVLILILLGPATRRLLENADPAARVSLGGGFWVSVAAISVIVYAASRSLSGWVRHVVGWSGLVAAVVIVGSGWLDNLSVLVEYQGYRDRFWAEALQHLRLSGFSVAIAIVLGCLLGVWASRSHRAKAPILFVSSAVQTIPSLALFGLIIAPLSALSFAYPVLREVGVRGIGTFPAIIALTIYSILPVVQNTYVGISRVDAAVVDAGRGMGMSRWQLFKKVEAPLATPIVLEGVRIASVQVVGLTAVAALVGAGGLGWFVLRGIGQAASDLIVLGAIPIIVLALVVDQLMSVIVNVGTPSAFRGRVAIHGEHNDTT